MKIKLNNKYVRWGLTLFAVIAAAIMFYYFLFNNSDILAALSKLTDILMPVVFGFVTAYLMIPILNYIEGKIMFPLLDKLGVKESRRRKSVVRGISVFLTAFIVIALIYMLFHMLISQLMPSIQNIVNNFDTYTNNVVDWVNKLLNNNPEIKSYILQTIDRYSEQLDSLMNELPSNMKVWLLTVTNTATSIIGVLWDFVIGFIISIYLMISKEKFTAQGKKMVYALFERDTANIIIRNFRFTHKTFIGFISGKIADSIIIGLLCFMGVTLLQLPYAALISVIIGLTNVIPFFGPYLGAIPTVLLVLIVDPMHPLRCVYYLIFILLLQQFDGNFLGPKILGNSTGLTSFWVIFSITFFGGLFGVFGMIVGVPLFAVIYAAIKSIINTKLLKKQMPIESNKYEKLEYVDELGMHDYAVTEPDTGKKRTKRTGKKSKNSTAGEGSAAKTPDSQVDNTGNMGNIGNMGNTGNTGKKQ